MGDLFRWQVGCGCGCICRDGLCLYRTGLHGVSDITNAVNSTSQRSTVCFLQNVGISGATFHDSELSSGTQLVQTNSSTSQIYSYSNTRWIGLVGSDNLSVLNNFNSPFGSVVICKKNSDNLYSLTQNFTATGSDCVTLNVGNVVITTDRYYGRTQRIPPDDYATLTIEYYFPLTYSITPLDIFFSYSSNNQWLGDLSIVNLASGFVSLLPTITPDIPKYSIPSGFTENYYSEGVYMKDNSSVTSPRGPNILPSDYYRNGAKMSYLNYPFSTIPNKYWGRITHRIQKEAPVSQSVFDDIFDDMVPYYTNYIEQLFPSSAISLIHTINISAIGIYNQYYSTQSFHPILPCPST